MAERDVSRKVAFVGTSCIGKTTLIENYKRRFVGNPNVGFVEEAARIYFTQNSHIPVSERFGFGPQSEIQDLAMQMEKEVLRSGARSIITDRSVLDAPAYVLGHGDIEGSNRLLDRVRHWIPTYQRIFLLDPADVPYVVDDVRLEDPEVRIINHEAFLKLFEQHNIDYSLLSGTIEERTQRVDEIILFQQ